MSPTAIISGFFCLASLVGSGMLGWAAVRIRQRRNREDGELPSPPPAISVLKPLHGDEPRLGENLATTLAQAHYPAPTEMVCGVTREDDPAVEVVRHLARQKRDMDLRLVIGPQRPWSNAKMGNLANIAAEARHEMLVLADSDMVVPPDYLARLAAALARPGVGAVTCLYVGRGDTGLWSRLVAAGIDTHFLPSSEIGLATGMAHPCMGSTIALRRTTLEAIGGFAAFGNILADDHALGAAVRAGGQQVAVPGLVLVHACTERSLRALVRQELRWNATIAGIDPLGYAGSFILHPLPLAILGWLTGGGQIAAGLVFLALGARAAVSLAASSLDPTGRPLRDRLAAIALVPARDLISFFLFLGSFVIRTVEWRGSHLRLDVSGRLTPRKDRKA